jgi:hypothetical protein
MSLITSLFTTATWPRNGFLGWQMKSLELTIGEFASEFTIAPIGKVHIQILFQKHFKFFQVLKCMACFVITICEKSADVSSATSSTAFPYYSRTLKKE